MKSIRIKSVSTYNFKGFKRLHVSFEENTAIILSGMNGFGKTTVFDALELLFTGTIQRMQTYAPFHDNRGNLSQNVLPLVYDKEFADQVEVGATIIVDEEKVTVCRIAKVSNMRNPVDFTAFSPIMIVDGSNHAHNASREEIHKYGLDLLQQQYAFLCYLSQEEATAFLKSREADRADAISKLFNLKPFDEPLAKVNDLQKRVKLRLTSANSNLKSIKDNIRSLQQYDHINSQQAVAYKPISKDRQFWDAENPNMTDIQLNSFLTEGGVMDGLLYYVRNIDYYKQYRLNQYIVGVEESMRLRQIVFWIRYSDRRTDLESYKIFLDRLQTPANTLKLDNLASFTLFIPDSVKDVIAPEIIDDFYSQRQSLLHIYQSTTTLQRDIAALMHSRDEMVRILNAKGEHLVTDNACPLCGQKYESFQELSEKIKEQGNTIQSHLSDTNKAIQQQFEQLRSVLLERIVRPIDEYYKNIGIDKEQNDFYNNNIITRLPQIEEDIHTLVDRLGVRADKSKSSEEIRLGITDQLSKLYKDIPADINTQHLQDTYSGYARYIKPECLNEKDIKSKRDYLLTEWSKKRSRVMEVQRRRLAEEQAKYDKLNELRSNLNALKNELTEKRQTYFGNLLNDIKILFYIYSGRIMQTNYFGRGLFIKPDDSCKHIIITTSGNDDNEVDALYNMSSGQLVSLTVALLLSLNKLYSQTNLLAIDDPIQTIDDINFWGLIETLRHDFSDHFMLLSTHEADYGSLLSYKFRKFGINTKYVDMAKVESER